MESRFYGAGLPKCDVSNLPGHLIVVEGADGVGRSTHIELLQGWLEGHGFAVATTGLVRSALTQRGIESAKEGHSFDRTTMSLFYATDLADRIENEIIPALRSGFVVFELHPPAHDARHGRIDIDPEIQRQVGPRREIVKIA